MNTYNDNLQITTSVILSGMQQEKRALQSANTAAEYTLYYSQSANITANEKLNKLVAQSTAIELMNNQGVENDNLAVNLLNTVTEASTIVANSVTDTSTCASNVQVAATAITQLAADLGSAYNVVSAEDNNTDIYRLTLKANEMIRKVAYKAERLSETAMLASANTAEIRTSQLLAETNVVKAGIENLLSVTDAEFSRLMEQKTVDSKNADTTSSVEKQNEGILVDSQTEYRAVKKSYKMARKVLNYGLRVKPLTLTSVSIEFTAFKQPFRAEKPPVPNPIPDASPTYYALVVPAARADLLSIEKAEQLFAEFRRKLFIPVTPIASDAATAADKPAPDDVPTYEIMYDSEGALLKPGAPYVVFLYIALSEAYKKYTNNLNDLLSAPSDSFTLTTDLPRADHDSIGVSAPNLLTFGVPAPWVQDAEYRVILLPINTPKTQRFMTASPDDTAANLDFYFNLDIATQISPANYTVATVGIEASDTPPTPAPAKAQAAVSKKIQAVAPTDAPTPPPPPSLVTYRALLDKSTTDNFGSQVEPGKVYIPAILSVMTEGSLSAQYQEVISDFDHSPQITFTNNFEVQLVTSN